MWGTFIGTKAKAYKETKFAKGGTDVFGGGSHASGNDTQFGTRNGSVLKAEGGERWAVFNKGATSHYGNDLVYLINGINKKPVT